jgi:hypothetical protein
VSIFGNPNYFSIPSPGLLTTAILGFLSTFDAADSGRWLAAFTMRVLRIGPFDETGGETFPLVRQPVGKDQVF